MRAVNEGLSVEAYFDPTGEITPRRFTWRGRTVTVEGVGRRWKEGRERCFAVLAAGSRFFELRLDEETFRWRVARVAGRGWAA